LIHNLIPSNFDLISKVHLYAPNCHQREEIIKAICEEIELYTNLEDVKQVAEMTPGYVGADLNLLCREALYLSLVTFK
jgi:ribosome biogenesis ATPase